MEGHCNITFSDEVWKQNFSPVTATRITLLINLALPFLAHGSSAVPQSLLLTCSPFHLHKIYLSYFSFPQGLGFSQQIRQTNFH